jgi:protein-L-isoaspartate(D-aspartate) O-methyltransferase
MDKRNRLFRFAFLLFIMVCMAISMSEISVILAAEKKQDPNEIKILPPDHNHPAFNERIEEREKMVRQQIQQREVKDPNVLAAMRIVPRHAFVRQGEQRLAYIDSPLPIGYDQTISQPYIVAFMTEALNLKAGSKVLEIGTGSGYQAAVCAEIAKEVYTIEIVKELAQSAAERLKELGYHNVFVRAGDGFFGWPDKAPFDAIIGTAAAGRIPQPLIDQLKPGGRMILPMEGRLGFQYLVLITKDEKGELHKKNVLPVRFVPMTGEVEKSETESKK